MNLRFYLDAETIPGQTPGLREILAAEIHPPANMSKPETIARWEAEEKPGKIENAYRKTALDGTLGELCVISWAFDEESIRSVGRYPEQSEAEMLGEFFETLRSKVTERRRATGITWIGHNVQAFDLRFLFQRAVILGVKPPVPLPHDARPGSDMIYDTMTAWAGFRNTVSQNKLCRALGIETKGDLDGSKVWDYMQERRLQEVMAYCEADVHRVREAHKRMTFFETPSVAEAEVA